MRYMIAVIDTSSGSGTEAEMVAIDEFNERLRARGQWVLACGFEAPRSAVVIDNRGGVGIHTNGPLHLDREFHSGMWVVDVPDHDTALTLAAAGSEACNRRVEVRRLL